MIIIKINDFGKVLVLIITIHLSSLECKTLKNECPIGFELSEKADICYSLKKDPERFEDKFVNCVGKSFKYNEYSKIGLPKAEGYAVWTDFKSLYPGGPYVDTSDDLERLETTYEVNLNPHVTPDEELCVVIDPVTNFTAVRCDEKHYRYCFVEKYSDSVETCDKLEKGKRFFGPVSTCLASTQPGRGAVRMNWSLARAKCHELGANLLGPGWRYYNSFETTESQPLDIFINSNHTQLRYSDITTIPRTEWNFNNSAELSHNGTNVAINRWNFWELVNSSLIYINPICEKSMPLASVHLELVIGSDNLMKLLVRYGSADSDRETLDEEHIKCFTDSSRYYPSSVSITMRSDDEYILKTPKDGYYWCTHDDSKRFHISESNKTLFIKVKEGVENWYAVKITQRSPYNFDNIGDLMKHVWIKNLSYYVSYYNALTNETDYDEATYNNYTVQSYGNAHKFDVVESDVIQKKQLKRLYLDARSVLLHVELYPGVRRAQPGHWRDMHIEYMKPVYYCDTNVSLGQTVPGAECKAYKCVGDFNNGVDLLIEAQEGCYLPTTLSAAVNVSTHVAPPSTKPPSTTPPPPKTHELSRDLSSYDNSSEEVTSYATPVNITTIVMETTYGATYSTYVTTSPTHGATNTTYEATESTHGAPETSYVSTDTTYGVTTVSNEVQTATSPARPPRPTTWPPTRPTTTNSPPTTEPKPPTPMPPQDQLDQVINDLELLLNSTDIFVVEDIEDAFTQVDKILTFDELEIPGNLLHLLDDIGSRIDLAGSKNTTTVRENIALLVADAQPDLPVRGLRVAVREGTDAFTNDTFEIIREDIESSQLSTDESEVVVSLPESVSVTLHRVSFVVFRNDRAFTSSHDLYAVNSRVLSVKVQNVTEFPPGEVIDIYLMPIDDAERNQSRACAYWQFDEDGVSGNWSQEGCTFIRASRAGQLDTCRCDHLTHFAEILVPRTVFSEANESALEILSVVGCCISILSLLIVGLTAILFRSWRRDYSNKIWLQLCISILILSLCFLVVVFAEFHENHVLCLLTGVILHYSVLSSFCWMLVAAVLSYRRLVLVFSRDASHKLLRAAAFAWGAPCVVLAILLSVAPHSYAAQFEDKSPSGAFCYPSGLALWLSVYAPIALMLLANWVLFILIVRSVFGSRRPQNHGHGAANEAFRCASVSCLLVFMFGLPWLFGLFSFNIVAAYLFTIFATFQGFVLFFFFVIGNKKTRDMWLNKLKIKQTRKIPVTSSTYTNRSTGANVPPRAGQVPATLEAKASKPRSLSSSDNSRFS